MIWMILSATFIALFPTWVSAMSGYNGKRGPFVLDQTGNFALFSEFRYIDYVIHDGDRIGLTKDYIISGNTSVGLLNTYASECDSWYNFTTNDFDSENEFGPIPAGCILRSNVSSYVTKYGFYGINSVNSSFKYTQTYNLSAPTLNISAYYIASEHISRSDWTGSRTGKMPFANQSDAVFVANGVPYPFDYLSVNGTCQPLGPYQWGFSFLLLFIFLLTLLIWSIGTYIFWLEAHLALKVRDICEIPGNYKAVIGLGAAIQREFVKEGEDITCLEERQIISRMRRDLKGGAIKNDGAIIRQPQYRFREVIKRWFRRDKWWFGGFVVLTAIWLTLLLCFAKVLRKSN